MHSNAARPIDMVEYYGGAFFECWKTRPEDCLLTCCCPCVAYGSSMERAGGPRFIESCGTLCAVGMCPFPCNVYFVHLMASELDKVNRKWGGRENLYEDYCVQFCFFQGCTICQLQRAVRGAARDGANMSPAPNGYAMSSGAPQSQAMVANAYAVPDSAPRKWSPAPMQASNPQYAPGPFVPARPAPGAPRINAKQLESMI
jgi:Cys-rich protein (TIGR01571 family)